MLYHRKGWYSFMNKSNKAIIKNIDKILEIGIALSVEKDCDKILEMILNQARSITNANAGTLYLCDGEDLVFKVMQNDSIDIENKLLQSKSNLPPVPISEENAAGYTVLSGQIINIPDVYECKEYNFIGPRRYDEITGYKTTSMMVVPLKNSDDKVIGVLQIINAKNSLGEIVPFSDSYQKVISSLVSQAAISITNIRNQDQIEKLMDSFVKSMATAIDARTPYNTSHTKRVAKLVENIINIINTIDYGKFKHEQFDKSRTEQLLMAAWLHDIGKVGTPLSIINKSSKLEDRLQLILLRLDYIIYKEEGRYWKRKAEGKWDEIEDRDYKRKKLFYSIAQKLINKINKSGYNYTESDERKLIEIAEETYMDEKGKVKNWLTEEELQALLIRRGTLTENERKIVENHVELGLKILKEVPFSDKLRQVPDFVSMHHEFLDGSGYPRGLKKDDIPLEARILTIVDIFDALTSSDRPYRKASSIEATLSIIGKMVNEGKLDIGLFNLVQKYHVWDCLE